MGAHVSFKVSRKLKRIVRLIQDNNETLEEALYNVGDMTSTGGYDNDGSTGPELIDNGASLGMACRDYSNDAEIFWCLYDEDCDKTAYYQYGIDETDALRRFKKQLEEWLSDSSLKADSVLATIEDIINE